LKALTPALSRRERGTKAAIRARIEYIFMIKKAPALSAGFVIKTAKEFGIYR